jgi:alkylation response protein AidB-like acyl-CoA dehydrogenase
MAIDLTTNGHGNPLPGAGRRRHAHAVHFGTPEQKEKWLRQLCDGTMRSCLSMTEPEVAESDEVHLIRIAEMVMRSYNETGSVSHAVGDLPV